MTIAEKVRGILTQRPLTKAEVVMILGITNVQARSCLNELIRSGMVVREGEIYCLGREKVARSPATREKALARYERNRRAKGQRPRAEYLAELAATREARNKAKLARRAEREREKRAAAAAVRPVRVKLPKLPKARAERQQAKRAALLARLEAAPVVQVAEPVRLMSSDEWGGPIQRLEPWEVSKPLRITREIVRRMAA